MKPASARRAYMTMVPPRLDGESPLPRNPLEPGPFLADRRIQAVAWEHPQRIVEAPKAIERVDHRAGVPAGQVHATERAREQRVAAVQPALRTLEQAHRTLGVAGRVQDLQHDGSEPNLAALLEPDRGDA